MSSRSYGPARGEVRGAQEPAGRGAWGIDKVERHLGGQFWNADVLVNDAF
jgi:hypothetical protein